MRKQRDSIFLKIVKSKVAKVFVSLFLLFNVVWLINWMTYHRLVTKYDNDGTTYFREDSCYIYSISEPRYLSFVGNYAVDPTDKAETLVIWPRIFNIGTPQYGVEIWDEEVQYDFYVDEDLNYIYDSTLKYSSEGEEHIGELLKKEKDTVTGLMAAAEREWNL